MKKIVSIIGGYAPDFSPGGRIATNVLSVLKENYDVTILAQKTKFGLKAYEEADGIKIIRIPDYNTMFHGFFEEKIRLSNRNLMKQFYKTMLLCKKVINYGFRILRLKSISYSYTRRLIHQLNKIKRNDGIDILIPVSAPHEAVAAAVKYKKKNKDVILVPYKLDRFAQGNSLYENKLVRKFRYPRNLKAEQETLNVCDSMFALPPIAEYYENGDFLNKEKVQKTEHPLLVQARELENVTPTDKISLVYAGSLDKSLRNPEYLLEMLSQIPNFETDYIFNLFSFGNCSQIIDTYKQLLGESLNDGGKIPSDKVSDELAKADILITIGNNSSNEVPSKLFEYLSYGKPIVHFYYNDNDAYIKYLADYEMSLCIKMTKESMEENKKMFVEFCEKNRGKQIGFDEIRKKFKECTPEYTANQFKTVIEALLMQNRKSVVVAHPNQQHSMRLATALKKGGLLHTYLTTVFFSKNSFSAKLMSVFGKNFVAKMERKRSPYIENETKTFCSVLGYAYYALMRFNYGLSCKLYVFLTKQFGKKVAKFAIKNNCKAVIMYDYTATECFRYLKNKAPEIVRILDMSSIPCSDIYNILSEEEKRGNGKYFENSRMRYTKKYCNYFEEEMTLADYFLSPSNFVDEYIRKHNVSDSCIYRAAYGVDLTDFKYNEKSVKKDEIVNFVFTGRLEGAKGITYLLEACDKIYERRQDFLLHLVGRNNIGNALFEGKKYIKFYGHVNKQQLIEIYNNMHVFVLPSLWEGMSQSTLEAVMSGMAVISSDRAGVSDTVVEKGATIIVPATEADKLADVMEQFLADKSAIGTLSKNCKNIVADFSWESYYNQAKDAVSDMLNKM